jgi:type I restriction enzyme, S subunit
LFGDHTKTFKFVKQPFALGADGVKILSPIGEFDKRFLYHYLNTIKLPDDVGYSRHFKFLKEKYVVKPPLAEQNRIAAILDKADAIRRKRQAAIKLADDFLRATFLDMFGDPVTNPKGWEVTSLGNLVNFTTGKIDSNAAMKGGVFPFFTCSKENYQIDIFAFDSEALLLAGNNATGDYSVKYYNGKFNAYQRTYVITITQQNLSYSYMQTALEMKLQEMKRYSKGTNTKYLTLGILNQLKFQVPIVNIQEKFNSVNNRIIDYKQKITAALSLSDNIFASCTQRAFQGEL